MILSGALDLPFYNQEVTHHENLYPFLSCMEMLFPVHRSRLGRNDDDRDGLGSESRDGARREV